VVRACVVPNLKEFEIVVKDDLTGNGEGNGMGIRKAEADKVLHAIFEALGSLVEEDEAMPGVQLVNGNGSDLERMRDLLTDKVGEVVGSKIVESGHARLAKTVLES